MRPLRLPRLSLLVLLGSIGLGCLAGGPAAAHHSFAMFDKHKERTLDGVVKELQWTNPHVWIQLKVANSAGGTDEWSIECTSVNFLTRWGWKRDTLKPGDRVRLTFFPLRDGTKGGSLVDVIELNGKHVNLVKRE